MKILGKIANLISWNSVEEKNEHLNQHRFSTKEKTNQVVHVALNQEMASLGTPKAADMSNFKFEFNKLGTKLLLPVDEKGPNYKAVKKGLNLSGLCENQDCLANKKSEREVVIIPLGIGKFNIPKESLGALCPSCKKTVIKVTNLGFFSCKYRIEGYQNNEKKLVDEMDEASNDCYTTFKQNEVTTWSFLEVTTYKA